MATEARAESGSTIDPGERPDESPMPLVYEVKPGETLGGILNLRGECVLWGPGNAVDRVLRLNPGLPDPTGNHLRPGQKLRLPAEIAARAPSSSCRLRQPAAVEAPPSFSVPAETLTAPAPLPPAPSTPLWRYSLFTFEPTLSFSRLDATDSISGASATLASGINLGGRFRWHPVFSESIEAEARAGFTRISYQAAGAPNTLQGPDVLAATFEIEAKYRIRDATWLGLLAGARQGAVLRGESAGVNRVDVLLVPELGAFAERELFRSGALSAAARLEGALLNSRSQSLYDLNRGYRLRGELSLGYGARTHDLHSAGLGAEWCKQGTTLTGQSTFELGAFLRFSLDFFSKGGEP